MLVKMSGLLHHVWCLRRREKLAGSTNYRQRVLVTRKLKAVISAFLLPLKIQFYYTRSIDMQWAVLFLWNTSWNCVLLFDTQSFMCFTQQTARRVSTTSVSRVPESRNLKYRHRVGRSELQQTACVQNFGVEWRETAELAFCLQPVKFSFHKHDSYFIIN